MFKGIYCIEDVKNILDMLKLDIKEHESKFSKTSSEYINMVVIFHEWVTEIDKFFFGEIVYDSKEKIEKGELRYACYIKYIDDLIEFDGLLEEIYIIMQEKNEPIKRGDIKSFYYEKDKNPEKVCLYPDCEYKDIKHAHNMQKNGILKRLNTENDEDNTDAGKVYMISKDFKDKLIELEPVFIKRSATKFWGFCETHDTSVFSDIENSFNDGSYIIDENKAFLYAYKAFALSYWKTYNKKIQVDHLSEVHEKHKKIRAMSPIYNIEMINEAIEMKNQWKQKFDQILMSKSPNKLDCIKSIIIVLNYEISFAVSDIIKLGYDFNGEILHFLGARKEFYINIFPHYNKSFAIVSWFDNDETIYNQLNNSVKTGDYIVYFNNYIPLFARNIVLSPRLWNAMGKEEKLELRSKITDSMKHIFENYALDDYSKCNLFAKIKK